MTKITKQQGKHKHLERGENVWSAGSCSCSRICHEIITIQDITFHNGVTAKTQTTYVLQHCGLLLFFVWKGDKRLKPMFGKGGSSHHGNVENMWTTTASCHCSALQQKSADDPASIQRRLRSWARNLDSKGPRFDSCWFTTEVVSLFQFASRFVSASDCCAWRTQIPGCSTADRGLILTAINNQWQWCQLTIDFIDLKAQLVPNITCLISSGELSINSSHGWG